MASYKKNAFTVLIPFYNEKQRIFDTLNIVTKAKSIDKIICVDDGSQDTNYKKIQKKYPQITTIRLEKNQGKSSAILHGLVSVTTEWVFFIDADLKNLQINEIENAIKAVKNSISSANPLDMLILRRSNYSYFVTAIRHDILMSGERILRTQDALAVFKKPPTGYQLEIAINLYMMQNRKNCAWIQTSLANSYKIDKWTPLEALRQYKNELVGYISYAGPIKYLKQVKNFCNTQYAN